MRRLVATVCEGWLGGSSVEEGVGQPDGSALGGDGEDGHHYW